ncbi:N-acetylmuramoyl-L-alanine amidase [Christensenella tenuis]|uniref:N-acetylmuramoyl-L-alanine amidase n=1 Tax=Christensenella tenuis TaxID=2763033 RepID=A0ABR7EFG5_9FIRM|nr:N-acetylmuramoyl-L-alanine amidase [Christensenella tenuis]MBC5648512.1 N-acetylmuramoyl-L-alanine amidase [Christensenella tenuis]
MKIYINPGHGGSDSGAVGMGGRQEKDDALRYASAVAEKLEQAGHSVNLERDGDYLIPVKEIAERANAWGADLFIAFHRNSGGGEGAECLIVSSASETSRRLAQAIQGGLVEIGFKNRGVKVQDKNTYVLSHTKCPAATIEAGFMDSAADNALFDSKFNEIVNEIARGILSIAGGSLPEEKEEAMPNRTEVEAYVDRLYRKVLDREPDAAGRTYHINELMNRKITPAQTGYSFYFGTEEMKTREANGEFISELYRGLLGREPDAAGKENWLKRIYKDMSREALFHAFTASAEFKAVEKKMGF